MTKKQWAHLDRKWLKSLKRSLQINDKARKRGLLRPLDPKRLPL